MICIILVESLHRVVVILHDHQILDLVPLHGVHGRFPFVHLHDDRGDRDIHLHGIVLFLKVRDVLRRLEIRVVLLQPNFAHQV